MHTRLAVALVSALLIFPGATWAQEPTPTPEHQALSFWIGTWQIEAEAKPNPLFPEGKYSARMTADWFQGGFHVLCHYDWTGVLGAYSELNILGYDPAAAAYYNYAIDGFGGGTIFRGPMDEDVWTYTADLAVEGQSMTFRWTVRNASPGVITWTSELSVDGGPWILAGEARAMRQ